MPACTKEQFRDMMVAHYRDIYEKEGEKGPVVGWANKYSPVLDVTSTVQEVDPTVEQALLTIYGDPAHVGLHAERLIVLGPNKSKIEFSDYARVRHWMQGIEPENMKCPNDGQYYLVLFPCKLKVKKPGQGGHNWLLIGTIVGLGIVGLMYFKGGNYSKVFMTGQQVLSKAREKLKR